jgi:hypothetical protein
LIAGSQEKKEILEVSIKEKSLKLKKSSNRTWKSSKLMKA